ncbi:hypothetical protein CEXT_49101 [Caerostris extrusa]|uniref:Uncharacterized protein n=1 Tax=Caerostris extrusa TaxID=172846 RepID=A0AAV4MN60_CAEEX|nr:hypothetical protein CEXT_49101 [Caerostris extrusa]
MDISVPVLPHLATNCERVLWQKLCFSSKKNIVQFCKPTKYKVPTFLQISFLFLPINGDPSDASKESSNSLTECCLVHRLLFLCEGSRLSDHYPSKLSSAILCSPLNPANTDSGAV